MGQCPGMSNTDPHRFDLNLVKVFLAIWDMRSLTGAGQRLGLTQPAVSHALRRLREQFSDPLFLRVGNRMEPTETATTLRAPFEAAFTLLEQTLHETRTFEPRSTTRSFRIAMTDTGEFYAMPRILGALEQAAPGAGLASMPIDPGEVEGALRAGQVDFALGYLPGLEATRCHGRFLLQDRLICLMRAAHPEARADWSAESFAQLSFVDVSPGATGYQMAREVGEKQGLRLARRARLEHFTIVPEVVHQTDLVALFPQSIYARLRGREGFHARDLPFEVPSYDIKLWSHESFAADPALIWLSDLIAGALMAPEAL